MANRTLIASSIGRAAQAHGTGRPAEARGQACRELGFAQTALDITDEPGSAPIGQISVEGHAVVPWDWSPDGSQLLFQAFPLDTADGRPCFNFDDSTPWYVWSAAGITTAPDRETILAEWQGPRYVQFVCTAASVPPSTQPPCEAGARPAAAYVPNRWPTDR